MVDDRRRATAIGPVSAAPWGSASILLISWVYIALMGADGPDARDRGRDPERQLHRRSASSRTTRCSTRARAGRVAHECIVDVRRFKKPAGIEVDDVAKRLMDYGFHAPTMSFPVAGHADDRADRERVEGRARPLLRRDDRHPRGDRARSRRARSPREDNLLKNAPHTARRAARRRVDRTPTRASRPPSPRPDVRARKFWPPVGRLNNVLGDRKLVCTCPDISDYG